MWTLTPTATYLYIAMVVLMAGAGTWVTVGWRAAPSFSQIKNSRNPGRRKPFSASKIPRSGWSTRPPATRCRPAAVRRRECGTQSRS